MKSELGGELREHFQMHSPSDSTEPSRFQGPEKNGNAKVGKTKCVLDEPGWRGRPGPEGHYRLWILFQGRGLGSP